MEELKSKSNNEISLSMLQMQQDYEALKQHILFKYDELIAIEKKYAEANEILRKRLTGESSKV